MDWERTVGAALRGRPCVDFRAGAATEGRPYNKYPLLFDHRSEARLHLNQSFWSQSSPLRYYSGVIRLGLHCQNLPCPAPHQ